MSAYVLMGSFACDIDSIKVRVSGNAFRMQSITKHCRSCIAMLSRGVEVQNHDANGAGQLRKPSAWEVRMKEDTVIAYVNDACSLVIQAREAALQPKTSEKAAGIF